MSGEKNMPGKAAGFAGSADSAGSSEDMAASKKTPPAAGGNDSPQTPSTVEQDSWGHLRALTNARIALGRAGVSLPTAEVLAFQLAHAKARDAVHTALDVEALYAKLTAAGWPPLSLRSQAADRVEYLKRPDKGRRLHSESLRLLREILNPDGDRLQDKASTSRETLGPDADSASATASARASAAGGVDLALVFSEGLSAPAIERNLTPFLEIFAPLAAREGLRLSRLCHVALGRVAVGDETGQALGAKLVAVLIGERPGLSSPDSMGVYLTWGPRPGLTDERRNCVSNIRPEGLSYERAADKLLYLATQALRQGRTGVELKDEQPGAIE